MPEEKAEGGVNQVSNPGQPTDPQEKAGWAIPEQYKTKVPGPTIPIPPLEGQTSASSSPITAETPQGAQQPISQNQEKKGNIFSNLINKVLRRS